MFDYDPLLFLGFSSTIPFSPLCSDISFLFLISDDEAFCRGIFKLTY